MALVLVFSLSNSLQVLNEVTQKFKMQIAITLLLSEIWASLFTSVMYD